MKNLNYWNRLFIVQSCFGKIGSVYIRFPESKTVLRLCFGFPLLIVFCFLHGQKDFSSIAVENKSESLILLQDNPRVQPYVIQNNFGKIIRLSKNSGLRDADILYLLRTNPFTSFELIKESKSRDKIPAVYKRYQQFYKGVKVYGGLLVLRETSDEGSNTYIDLVSSNVKIITELDVHPRINKSELQDMFCERIVSADLIVNFDKGKSKLTWIVQFASETDNIRWVDPNTGQILKQYTAHLNLIAETPTYGTKFLHDSSSGGTTSLQASNGSIKIYDGLEVNGPLTIGDFDISFIPKTTNTSTWGPDASPGALQAFHVVERIKPIFNNIDINFGNINVAISGEARAIDGSNTSNAYLQIGEYGTSGGSVPAQLYDIIAHELGHCILLEQGLGIQSNDGNNALHEGISDIIGTYIESFIQGLDWVLGDDEDGPQRNLQDYVCFTELPDPPNQFSHEYGRVIGHMFYLIVNGSQSDGIPQIGLQPAMDIIKEAIELITDPETAYPEMRTLTLNSASILYGICSPHYQAVVNAWDKVCVSGLSESCSCNYSAPQFTSGSINVSCPVSLDLLTLFSGTIPLDAELIFSTDSDPWTGHGVDPVISSVITYPGTYYAYLYNATEDCYSPPYTIVVSGEYDELHYSVDDEINTDIEVFGNIYVEDGAVLTITSTVTFGEKASLIIDDDSKLVLDGGTLTACGNTWEGVKVAGQFDLGSYSPPGSFNLKRGYVELKDGAVIEKATVGIDGRDLFVSDGDITPVMKLYHGGGKITISSGSIIQDCGIGVRLHRYGWGSVIGAGSTGPGYPIGFDDEQSAFSNSFFKNCTVAAIYSDLNIGLSLINNEFSGNFADYEGYLSSITAIGNDFLSPLSFIASEHPVIPGSNFTNNIFANSILSLDGQGNTKHHIFKQNSVDASALWLTGQLLYGVNENAFSNSGYIGLFTESTGDNFDNRVMNNSFSGHKYAISVFGENDTEYLANCFSNTTYADLEINSGSSIHETQGIGDQSAGNCFNYYGRIKTGPGILPFTYWTKDGYHASCQPVLNCKYPGACNGFSLERSDVELDVDCETNIIGDPPSELNCACGSGLTGCIEEIASVRSSISGLGTDAGSNLLNAQYKRCLDKLIRTYVDTALVSGHVENCIDFLSVQPEFRYRVMAYGIMTHNLEYERAWDFIDTMVTSKTEEDDFVLVQKIWLDYITDIDSFILSSTDSMKIRVAGEAFNPLAGYARTVFYKLTRERITRDFIHTDSTITPRNISEIKSLSESSIQIELDVWPNPVSENTIDIRVGNANPEKKYQLAAIDVFGKIHTKVPLTISLSSVQIGDAPGIYMVCLLQDGEIIITKKVIKN